MSGYSEQTVTKWVGWLDIIRKEVEDLCLYRHIFHELEKILNSNPNLQKPSVFYDSLINGHIALVVSGVRRQIKCDDTSISLMRLMEQMKSQPNLLTKERFVNLYQGSVVESLAEGHFQQFSGTVSKHIDPALIQKDIDELSKVVKTCEEYADKKLAHTDARPIKKIPTFEEINKAISFVEKLVIKYYMLLTAKGYSELLPAIQYDWMTIFEHPWLIGKDVN